MKYGYHCTFCGHTVTSNDTKIVKAAKDAHTQKVRNPFFPLHGPRMVRTDCTLGKTNKGTLARPRLIPTVNERAN